jgi:hypothetical protein
MYTDLCVGQLPQLPFPYHIYQHTYTSFSTQIISLNKNTRFLRSSYCCLLLSCKNFPIRNEPYSIYIPYIMCSVAIDQQKYAARCSLQESSFARWVQFWSLWTTRWNSTSWNCISRGEKYGRTPWTVRRANMSEATGWIRDSRRRSESKCEADVFFRSCVKFHEQYKELHLNCSSSTRSTSRVYDNYYITCYYGPTPAGVAWSLDKRQRSCTERWAAGWDDVALLHLLRW